MIEEQATVVAVGDELITVTSTVKSACSGCQQVEQCGSGQVAKAFPQKQLTLSLATKLPVQVGDQIVFGLSESMLLSAAWQVYLWPIMGLLSCSWFGQWLINNGLISHEFIAILLGVTGGYLGFLLAKLSQKRSHNCAHLAPKVLRIVNRKITVTQISE